MCFCKVYTSSAILTTNYCFSRIFMTGKNEFLVMLLNYHCHGNSRICFACIIDLHMLLSTIYCIAMEMQHCVLFISVVKIKIFFNVNDWWTVLTAWYYLTQRKHFYGYSVSQARAKVLHFRKCPIIFPNFNQILSFVTDFYRCLQYQISPKSVQWEWSSHIQTEGQTDVT